MSAASEPRERSGDAGVPASERAGGSGGAKPPGKTLDKAPARIASMFDAIAKRYDLLNHVLSVGLDVRWRACAIREAQLAADARVLDLCTGTADLAIAAVRAAPTARIVGLDFAGA